MTKKQNIADLKEMSTPEKTVLCRIISKSPKLPYPLKMMEMPEGFITEMEYEIPETDKAEILKDLYPFAGCPSLDDKRLDIHSGNIFNVKDYRVIRYNGRNLVVAPEYDKTGGMVVDWITPDEPSELMDIKEILK